MALGPLTLLASLSACGSTPNNATGECWTLNDDAGYCASFGCKPRGMLRERK